MTRGKQKNYWDKARAESLMREIGSFLEPQFQSSELVEKLSREINKAVGFGVDFYYYMLILERTKDVSPNTLRKELQKDEFIELLRDTLIKWMGNRYGSYKKAKGLEEFKEAIQGSAKEFVRLAEKGYTLESFKEPTSEVFQHVKKLYDVLNVVDTSTGTKIVSNSKVMHFILPNLFVPIDWQNTLKVFGISNMSPKREWEVFREVHIWASKFAKAYYNQLEKLVEIDENRCGWNQTIPKTIDNLIIYYNKRQVYRD